MSGTDERRRRRRLLSADEQALWSTVTRAVKPLRTTPSPAPQSASDLVPEQLPVAPRPVPSQPARLATPAPTKPPPVARLERRLKQRIARGNEPIGGRIDLHGMTQAEAHRALLSFLRGAQASGAKVVLVITGKGSRGTHRDTDRHGGVLRRQVPLWLALPECRELVVGFENAHAGHGGEGALYVRLRRRRGDVNN